MKNQYCEKSQKWRIKRQDGAPDSSVDTQENGVEFSENPKRPNGLEESFSDSDGDEQEAT